MQLSAKGAARIPNPQAASNCAMTSVVNDSEQARKAQDVRLVVETIPTLAWSARADANILNALAPEFRFCEVHVR